MFESLDKVHWKRAWHAYGSAKDVPGLLRGLASADESVRRDALWQLQGNIFHQGNRWEAAAKAVPSLFTLALDPATPDRDRLVFFLVSLAFGDEDVLPISTMPEEMPERWAPAERAAYDAVAQRVMTLAPLLREAEPLRVAAAFALGHFPMLTAETAGEIHRVYDASTDETARATLLIALAMVSLHATDKNDAVSLFRHVHDGDDGAILRASAAAGLALLGAADDAVARTITAMIIDASAEDTEIPWNDGDFDEYLAMVLPVAARGREADVAATLIAALPHASRQAKFRITHALVDVVAPSAGHRALSDVQRHALQAIEEHGQWDENGGAVINFALLSNAYGLPGDREDFRSFVAAAEASARGEDVAWKPRERPRAPKRVDPEAAAYLVILFGVPLLLWLLVVVNHPDLLPSTPREWGWLSFLVLGLGVSIYFLRRLSSVKLEP